MQTRNGLRLAVLASAALPLLAGCHQEKIVAKVNDVSITEADFNAKLMHVRAGNFPQELNLDAGGVTMLNLVQASIIDQCAKEPPVKYTPTDEALKSYVAQVMRMFPDMVNRIKGGEMTEEDLMNSVKSRLELLAIGTDGATPDDKEIQAMYDELKTQNSLDYPALYTIRFVTLPDLTTAKNFLDNLKKTGSFKTAATAINIPAESAAQVGRTTVLAQKQLPPKVTAVLDTLKGNDFTPEPVEFTINDPNQPGATPSPKFMVAQLVNKEAAKTPTIAEIKSQLIQMALEKKFPQWSQHAAQRVADYTDKAKIDIQIEKYKPLLNNVIIPSAKRSAASANVGAGAPGGAPGGVAPGGPAPGGATQGEAPPTGGAPGGAMPGGKP